MIIITDQEELGNYVEMQTAVACVIYGETCKLLRGSKIENIDSEFAMVTGDIVGTVVYEKVQELVKDMSREQLILWFAQSFSSSATQRMNHDPQFRMFVKVKYITSGLDPDKY
jgi:hypothetical protein